MIHINGRIVPQFEIDALERLEACECLQGISLLAQTNQAACSSCEIWQHCRLLIDAIQRKKHDSSEG